MPRVAVVFFSATGTTAQLAAAVCSGAAEFAESVPHQIHGHEIIEGRFRNEAMLQSLDDSDAIVFGSPTYMGGPAAQFKAFADASSDRWSEGRWRHKVAAGFTTGTCANGDQGNTLAYFSILAAQQGMIWCNLDIPCGHDAQGRNRLGTQLGVVSQTIDDELLTSDLLTATHLGRQVAILVNRLNGNQIATGQLAQYRS